MGVKLQEYSEVNQDKKSIIDVSVLMTATGAISTIASYVIAQSYHDGYLQGLNLSSSMYPMQSSDVTSLTVSAIFSGVTGVLGAISKIVISNLLICMALVVSIVVLLGLLSVLKGKAKKHEHRLEKIPKVVVGWLVHPKAIHWTRPALGVIAVFYFIFTSLVVIGAVIVLVVVPFVEVGKRSALDDLEGEFKKSPIAKLKSPEGTEKIYSVVQCSAQFCAFYSGGHIISVPVSEVKWVISNVKSSEQPN